MKNLFLKDYYLLKLGDQKKVYIDFDELSFVLYLIDESKILYAYEFNKENPFLFKILFSKDLSSDCEKDGEILSIKFILEIESVIVIMKGGDILKYNHLKNEVSNEGSIENGISNALWSPNQEHLIIATNNKSLILLDVNFDFIKEVPLEEDEALIKDLDINVNNVSLVWREDSKYISMNFPTHKGRKILTRDLNLKLVISAAKADADNGIVKSVSEKPLANLCKEIEWIPNGSLMVGSERVGIDQKIILWEKNGLNHGEFILPKLENEEENLEIISIKSSKDSEILAVLLNQNKKQYCLFYVRSNYRWYLKKQSCLKNYGVSCAFWGSKARRRFIVAYHNGFCEIFDFSFEYKSNSFDFLEQKDLGLYCSLDYKNALITNFYKNIIPPPMCSLELISSDSITAFSLGPNFILLINDNFFEFCFILDEGKKLNIIKIKNDLLKNENNLRHALFLIDPKYDEIANDNEGILGNLIVISNKDEIPYVNELIFYHKNLEISIKETFQHRLFHNIVGICSNGLYYNNVRIDEAVRYVYVQYQNGNVYKYFLKQGVDQNSFPFKMILEISTQFQSILAINIENNEHILGLSENNRLFFNNKIISNECTTFAFAKGFLIFTANSPGMFHLLYVLDLTLPNSIIFNSENNVTHLLPKSDSKLFNVRNIERGSKIVKVINEKIVFQLPRGNLETIYSKILVLKIFKNLMLESKKYRQAFDLLRQHKLEMNLIFDINPKYFIKNAHEIIKNIEKNDYINLFLSNISNDISENLCYVLKPEEIKEIKEFTLSQNAANRNWKVNLICDETKNALEKINKDRYILSIMTTYLKRIPSELEQCLEIIREFKQIESSQETKEQVPPHLNPESKIYRMF